MFTMSAFSLIALSLLLLVASVGAALAVRRTALNRRSIIAALLVPGFAMLALIYSLVMHMHAVLGGWPVSIGNRGFPPGLVRHAEVTLACFSTWAFFMLFIWPILFVVCLSAKRLRKYLLYVGVHTLSFFICVCGIFVAPSGFLTWWWD